MAFGIDIPQDAFLLNPSLIPFQFILCENKILNIVKKKKNTKTSFSYNILSDSLSRRKKYKRNIHLSA